MTRASPTVKSDETGIYVVVQEQKYRPGGIPGYDHVHRMDAASLTAGVKVQAKRINYTALTRIYCPDGVELVWGSEYLLSTQGRNNA
jgi:hypothetical protein